MVRNYFTDAIGCKGIVAILVGAAGKTIGMKYQV